MLNKRQNLEIIFLFLSCVSVNISTVLHENVENNLKDYVMFQSKEKSCGGFWNMIPFWNNNCNDDHRDNISCTYFEKFALLDSECILSKKPPFYTKCTELVNNLTQQENCTYKPEEFLDVLQTVAAYGYDIQAHNIVTEDGYILEIHRIPNKKKQAQPVFLQHGLFGTSADFILNGNDSLAFQLANEGYDVWLGNSRGNAYSDGHIKFPNHNFQYWNYSLHEMGKNDLDKVMMYITLVTKMTGEIIYIGHSTGTMLGLIYASTRPNPHSFIKLMVSISPTVYIKDIKTPLAALAPFSSDPEWLQENLSRTQFRPSMMVRDIFTEKCIALGLEKILCDNFVLSIFGFNEVEFNLDMLQVVLTKLPSGVSAKAITHFCQGIKKGSLLQMFDYGQYINLARYNSRQPPTYNLQNIKIPIFIMYSTNDWLSNHEEINSTSAALKNVVGIHEIQKEGFGYLDFLAGKMAKHFVVEPLLEKLKDFQPSMNSRIQITKDLHKNVIRYMLH